MERGATRAVSQPHYDALRAAQKHAKGVRAEWGLEECTWETVRFIFLHFSFISLLFVADNQNIDPILISSEGPRYRSLFE